MFFLHICYNIKFWDLTDTFLYLKYFKMVVSKNAMVYFMFGALLNTPIYVREADLEP